MTQSLVLQRISGTETVAHESMHVATFIYYLIKKSFNDGRRLNDLFSWTLNRVTIIQDDTSMGCFYHRGWKHFTEEAEMYCCFAGMLGGYLFTGYDQLKSKPVYSEIVNEQLSTLEFAFNDNMNSDKLIKYYNQWGASGDISKTNIVDYELQVKYINDIIQLMKRKAFGELFFDCMVRLKQQHTLEKDDLIDLANKHRESIILDVYRQKRTYVSLDETRPIYTYL